MMGMSPGDLPNERLEAEIAQGAANLAAARCRWLELVAEFDRRELAGSWGARSTAHGATASQMERLAR
jgi:hypothetical protein